ncbi:MAG: phosphoribosylformylglycinamidine synthase II [Deltaproteobacteria bacterium CG11_big_fil_rev_8_21_14_0_20_47_16]|nr:MAG: phosphoribosylformylglycinamidine synthase II [Deltaproteobacteria bacterium CG11_big_fil_rev_8_21_14_0_20_47_16]
MTITPDQIASHGLSPDEYSRILELIGREPTLTELGIFSVMWSEHCSYKSSRIHLKNFPTKGPQVLQGPGENAGIVDIGDGDAIAFKMESHNHPSYIEPYQGAATGVGGILRDVFTMGARPIANLNSLRFGEPSHPKTAHLVRGVVAGIGGYGNCVGVPTVAGEIYFDACYNGNILVNAMTVGHVRQDEIFRGFASGVGNPVIYVGSKTGRDGIHGATMASDVFDDASDEKRPTVQVGDPFTEKLLLEACIEAMKTGAIVGIQDMGAAGLTSSSFEMASRAGTGIVMDLDKVPNREPGMTAYELMLSESQERMLMVVTKGRESEILEVFEKWELDASIVGEVTNDGRMKIIHHGEAVVDLPVAPLADAAPLYDRPRQKPEWLDALNNAAPVQKTYSDWNAILLQMMGSANLCSRAWVYEQYDQSVGANTVTLPGSDSAVVRVDGTKKAVATAVDCNSRYCYLDPYWGGAHTLAECARNVSCSGALPLAATDCLNFGNPERPEIMWQFERAVAGVSDACRELNVPIVSGNVSLYNESVGSAIYPTPTIGVVGLLKDVSRHVTSHFQKKGDVVILLGGNELSLGGSEFAWVMEKRVAGRPPVLDLKLEKNVQALLREWIAQGKLLSAHDVSDGGIAVALAECCFKNELGAQIELKFDDPMMGLFGEGGSRIIITCERDSVTKLFDHAKKMGVPALPVGIVGGTHLKIGKSINVEVAALKHEWSNGFSNVVGKE